MKKRTHSTSILLILATTFLLGAGRAQAAGITYTCDPSVDIATCNYLNTTVASLYSIAFTNANADIYITYGTTGLAESVQFPNSATYDQYVAALAANPTKSAIQSSALTALKDHDAKPYGAGNVEITAALGTALGFTGLTGIAGDGATACDIGSDGCYDAYVVVTNDPGTPLYYDNLGGPEPADAYDFYATVEHETDEVLGTSSCMSTSAMLPSGAIRTIRRRMSRIASDAQVLADNCGGSTPSAVDLFRYNREDKLALNSDYIGAASAPTGAYFSFDGGKTKPVIGVVGSPKFYNTLANGEDYADFASSTPDCGTNQAVQDAEGCPGEDAGLNIQNDGWGEINILNAVGYDRQTATISDCNSFHGGIFKGSLKVEKGETCVLGDGGTVTAGIIQDGGTLTISNFIVGGNVEVHDGTFSIGPAVAIDGDVVVHDIPSGTAASQVCGTTVKGNLQVLKNATAVQVGSASASCTGNVINAGLDVEHNSGATSIFMNAVAHDLLDLSNSGATEIFNNSVGEKLRCDANASITGDDNTAKDKLGQCMAF